MVISISAPSTRSPGGFNFLNSSSFSRSSPFIRGSSASTIAVVYLSMESERFMTIRITLGYIGSRRALLISSGPSFLMADIAIGSMYVPTAYTLTKPNFTRTPQPTNVIPLQRRGNRIPVEGSLVGANIPTSLPLCFRLKSHFVVDDVPRENAPFGDERATTVAQTPALAIIRAAFRPAPVPCGDTLTNRLELFRTERLAAVSK
mmetsp:Transcript_32211/g.96557  ORF Transcript_32211/g.96557 Transcript_32211/m.96557 type:complete len:204 (-) Transcript_32211:253-864(-)